MTAQQFDDSTSNASISKLMAGAIMIDGGCSDLAWADPFPMSHSPVVKMERNEAFSNNVDCWPTLPPNHHNGPLPPNEFPQNSFQQRAQNNNGFTSMSNGSISGHETSQSNTSFLQNFGNNHFKPPQDQCRQKYGNYSNEKYPDFNVKPERKWNTCAVSPNRDMFNLRPMGNNPSSSNDERFSPPVSFNGSSLGSSFGQKNSPEAEDKKFFDFAESDSDSKASGTDSQGRDCRSNGNTSPLAINVDQMINSGITVAGYKPRKLICKRKKATVPPDLKDPGYWEKRKKNNDSARRSREAKKEKERNFYKRALELEYENHYLKERVAFLERKLETVMQQNPGFHGNDAPPAI